jgi:hypothetical protein
MSRTSRQCLPAGTAEVSFIRLPGEIRNCSKTTQACWMASPPERIQQHKTSEQSRRCSHLRIHSIAFGCISTELPPSSSLSVEHFDRKLHEQLGILKISYNIRHLLFEQLTSKAVSDVHNDTNNQLEIFSKLQLLIFLPLKILLRPERWMTLCF